MSSTAIFVIVAVFAALALVARLIKLFRQSDEIEKTLDYSKMVEWEDEDD